MGDQNSSQASYIHLVHHLIEECILFNMGKEECMDALFKHANIKPIITSTVWKELEKENKEFLRGIREKTRRNTDRERDSSKNPRFAFTNYNLRS